jgi:hypothetical protein
MRGNDMVEELITIEQLERVRRLIKAGQEDLAVQTLDAMIDGRLLRIESFEKDMWENVPV